jgi:LysM repeat protein
MQSYPIAVGKPDTPTPPGQFQVINKIINPGGILGSRWMGLNIPQGNYGIHGTNNPASIGKAVSNGCIRMHNHHIEALFPQIEIGTLVIIIKENSKSGSPVPDHNPNSFSEKQIYIVQPQDTLWKIARRFGFPLQTLITLNQIENPDLIYPGQKIILPK